MSDDVVDAIRAERQLILDLKNRIEALERKNGIT